MCISRTKVTTFGEHNTVMTVKFATSKELREMSKEAVMDGFASMQELLDLWFTLRIDENERAKPFALFVPGQGMLNGEQALEYLNDKFHDAEN